MMERKTFRLILSIFVTALLLGSACVVSLAYFDRGPMELVLASDNVTVSPSESVKITATANPSSDSQLPGCGMAECPQTCGEKDCLNEDGDCKCGGLTAKTYYADISTSSSNSGVAKVSYENGAIDITGVTPGEATITVTAMLRQYTATSKTISVTVTAGSAAPAASEAKDAAVPAENGGEIVVVKNDNLTDQDSSPGGKEDVTSQKAVGAAESNTNPDSGFRSIETDKGQFNFYDITGGLIGKKEMEAVAGKKATAVFQAKDNSDTILYSWSFSGQDITKPADFDMTIDISRKGTAEQAELAKGASALYLDFANEGKLPAPAEINIRVNEMFANGTVLYLYRYTEGENELELIADGLKVENGYASFTLDHCSQYILSDADLLKQSAVNPMVYAGIGILVLAMAGFISMILIRRKRNGLSGGRP